MKPKYYISAQKICYNKINHFFHTTVFTRHNQHKNKNYIQKRQKSVLDIYKRCAECDKLQNVSAGCIKTKIHQYTRKRHRRAFQDSIFNAYVPV